MELSKKRLAALEEDFEDYCQIDRLIAIRSLEIEHPWRESDGNIGGGRASTINKPQESITLKKDADKQLNRLLSLRRQGDNAINRMNDEQLNIFSIRFKSDGYYDWDTIGDLTHNPHSQIYRKRYKILELLANEQGIC
ncbi:transcriptional activator [Latilactobacillus phage TMW 1.1397 P1]|uniref:transcriptional regulator n=1 Tax=Latilactobacillus sakei TaxID=1599 RepID=UPI00202F7CB3|nr:transcriptional regulator [Latilactobacillus sakei]MCM1597553.1 transcriptional regulator [Latilactobacillus sakei]WAX23893.1 transcriptional activator [Latilactobacillus phage TMW 1.1397 P1]